MKKVLLITSSGGGGLLQSAIAIEQDLLKKDKNIKIVKKDLLVDLIPLKMGVLFRDFYNFCQTKGYVFLLNWLINCNIVADILFYPFVFSYSFFSLCRNKFDRVIDNQPISPKAVIKAIIFYNLLYKKEIILEKVFVDLPTKGYKPFLKSIKRITKKEKKHLKIISIEPLLEKEKTNEEFWQKYCKISEAKVVYKKYLIREAFKKYQNIEKPTEIFKINIKTKCLEESFLINKCLQKGSLLFKEKKEGFEIFIKPEDSLSVLLLGSQPASNATYRYTKNFIERTKEFPTKKFHMFVFCSKFQKNNKKNLFYQIFDLIKNKNIKTPNFTIIPISFQKDDVIADLFHRSDFTITKSGGQTIMELMAISKGRNFIHSEEENKEKLLDGIPLWEGGNALYLKEKFQGEFINPSLFKLAIQ